MRLPRIPAFLTVPALCLTIVLSIGSSVSADGIAGQYKRRMPMRPGLELDKDLLRQAFILVPAVPSKTERVVMKMRKDQRAAARKVEKVAAITTDVVVSPIVQYAPSRDRLASKGANVPTECQKFHTHERATCIYQSQLKKTVRAQTVTQK